MQKMSLLRSFVKKIKHLKKNLSQLFLCMPYLIFCLNDALQPRLWSWWGKYESELANILLLLVDYEEKSGKTR